MDTVHFTINGGMVTPEIDMPISATILDLKEKIKTVLNVPVARQTIRMTINSHDLENDRIIGDLNLGPSASVFLDIHPMIGLPKFYISVKWGAEDIFYVRVTETMTVLNLKEKIERRWDVLAKSITLRRLSEEMEDYFPLHTYYVCKEGCQVEMTVQNQFEP